MGRPLTAPLHCKTKTNCANLQDDWLTDRMAKTERETADKGAQMKSIMLPGHKIWKRKLVKRTCMCGRCTLLLNHGGQGKFNVWDVLRCALFCRIANFFLCFGWLWTGQHVQLQTLLLLQPQIRLSVNVVHLQRTLEQQLQSDWKCKYF